MWLQYFSISCLLVFGIIFTRPRAPPAIFQMMGARGDSCQPGPQQPLVFSMLSATEFCCREFWVNGRVKGVRKKQKRKIKQPP